MDADIDLTDLDLSDDADLFPAEIDVDDIDTTEYDRYTPDTEKLRAAAFGATISRWAGQLNTIDLAAAVKAELEPLTTPAAAGAILEACVVKLGLDILSGNLKPKSVREATGAIEALTTVSKMLAGGDANATMTKDRRMEVFAEIRERVTIVSGKVEQEPEVRDALEATYRELPADD